MTDEYMRSLVSAGPCPAAKHHRMRSYDAPRIVGWNEEGPEYSDKTLTSDRCTACGYDFVTADQQRDAIEKLGRVKGESDD